MTDLTDDLLDIPDCLRRGHQVCTAAMGPNARTGRPRYRKPGGRITKRGYYGDLLEQCAKERRKAAEAKREQQKAKREERREIEKTLKLAGLGHLVGGTS